MILLLGAGLYGLGLLLDTGSVPGDANIGAGIAMLFGEFVGVLGLGVLVVWAIAVLVIRLRQRNQRMHGQESETTDPGGPRSRPSAPFSIDLFAQTSDLSVEVSLLGNIRTQSAGGPVGAQRLDGLSERF